MSASKNELAYGKMISSGEYSHLDNRKCSINNNSFQKLTGASLPAPFEENKASVSNYKPKKSGSVSHRIQSTCQGKNKSISERLDTTETLLKKINRKFDDIFKDGPKINIGMGTVRKSKKSSARKSEVKTSTTSK